jgi:hypothetical protein
MPSKLTRAACFFYSGVFLFFLLYSAPHRVHHSFDSYQQAHQGADADDHRSRVPRTPIASDSNCVFQAAANICQLAPTALVQFFPPSVILADLTVPVDSAIRQRFLPHAFQIRAPPKPE